MIEKTAKSLFYAPRKGILDRKRMRKGMSQKSSNFAIELNYCYETF